MRTAAHDPRVRVLHSDFFHLLGTGTVPVEMEKIAAFFHFIFNLNSEEIWQRKVILRALFCQIPTSPVSIFPFMKVFVIFLIFFFFKWNNFSVWVVPWYFQGCT